MIDVKLLFARVSKLNPKDLERWVAMAWVRPETGDSGYLFHEIDVARVALIRELVDDMHISEEALPIVLSLLDQLYDARRRIREVGEVLADVAPEQLRVALLSRLTKQT